MTFQVGSLISEFGTGLSAGSNAGYDGYGSGAGENRIGSSSPLSKGERLSSARKRFIRATAALPINMRESVSSASRGRGIARLLKRIERNP